MCNPTWIVRRTSTGRQGLRAILVIPHVRLFGQRTRVLDRISGQRKIMGLLFASSTPRFDSVKEIHPLPELIMFATCLDRLQTVRSSCRIHLTIYKKKKLGGARGWRNCFWKGLLPTPQSPPLGPTRKLGLHQNYYKTAVVWSNNLLPIIKKVMYEWYKVKGKKT